MTEKDYVAKRMDRAMDKAIDLAETKERDRGVALPASVIGQMGLEIFRTRMAIAMRDPDEYDLPTDEERGLY